MSAMRMTGPVCGCAECVEHGVANEPQRRVPADAHFGKSRLIHGRELAAWLKAKEQTFAQLRQAIGPRGRRGQMERLVVNLVDEVSL